MRGDATSTGVAWYCQRSTGKPFRRFVAALQQKRVVAYSRCAPGRAGHCRQSICQRREGCAMEKSGGHAVVLGASMGGLLAARVLADFYDRVTVVERDVLPSDPVNRRGVPQGRLIHAVQARGTQIFDELFPGFVDELTAMGVESWEGDLSKLHFAVGGHQLVRSGRAPNPPVILFPSRPVLEWNVRRRGRGIADLMLLEGHDVVGLTATTGRDRVTGVRVVDRAGDCETTLSADLVVDATGRGSRTPVFLEELGYRRPSEDEL